MEALISIQWIFYIIITLAIFYLIYFILSISYCYSNKEELKLSDLSKEDVDSKEMIRFLIIPYYNAEESIYFKTKLKYLRNIILYGEYLLFVSIDLIFLNYIFLG